MSSPSLQDNWKVYLNTPNRRWQIIGGTAIMLAIIFTLPFFYPHIQKRKGAVLNDWLLARIPPHNVSVLIFALIWGMVLLIVIRAISRPSIFITACWTLVFVFLLRFVTISMVALDPPAGLIPLADPLSNVFYGHNAAITKDLFFSGHTANMLLFYLCLQKPRDKRIALIAAFAVACLLLVQHVHYTIDILAGVVIVYACYRLTRWLFFR
jgi:membrane-associated phospholipid phosphatase